jgi:hypothetical protein
MTSITVNLTLEQVLEFVQNLPLEYKKAVKEKLESEKVEEINQNATTNSISCEQEIISVQEDEEINTNSSDAKQDRIAHKIAIVEELAGSWEVPEDFDVKKEYRNLIIKKYTQE